MGRKVNPKIFRIPLINLWDSKWFANKNKFRYFLKEDLQIRKFLKIKLKNCGISNIIIERFPGIIRLIIRTAKPGLIIGRGGNGVEELKASHILIKVEPGADARRDLETLSQNFYESALIDSFTVVAADHALEIKETQPFTEIAGYVQGIGRVQMLIDFAFKNEIGDVAPPYRSDKGEYSIAKISYEIGDHYKLLEDLKKEINDKLTLQKKMKMKKKEAEAIAPFLTAENFDQVVKDNDLTVVNTDLISETSNIPGVGREAKLVQDMIELQTPESITGVIRGNKAFFIAKILEFQGPDMTKFAEKKDAQRIQVENQLFNQNYNQWFNKVKEDAKVKDWRSKFFRI